MIAVKRANIERCWIRRDAQGMVEWPTPGAYTGFCQDMSHYHGLFSNNDAPRFAPSVEPTGTPLFHGSQVELQLASTETERFDVPNGWLTDRDFAALLGEFATRVRARDGIRLASVVGLRYDRAACVFHVETEQTDFLYDLSATLKFVFARKPTEKERIFALEYLRQTNNPRYNQYEDLPDQTAETFWDKVGDEVKAGYDDALWDDVAADLLEIPFYAVVPELRADDETVLADDAVVFRGPKLSLISFDCMTARSVVSTRTFKKETMTAKQLRDMIGKHETKVRMKKRAADTSHVLLEKLYKVSRTQDTYRLYWGS